VAATACALYEPIRVSTPRTFCSSTNHSVALENRYYKLFGKALPKAKLQGTLPSCETVAARIGKRWGAKAFKQITDRLYVGLDAFFAGDIKRPPTFRKRHKYRSFTLKQAGYKILGYGGIKILGRNYRVSVRATPGLHALHRDTESLKRTQVSYTSSRLLPHCCPK
jgi:hypothetical protein